MNPADPIAMAERVEGLDGPCREVDVLSALSAGIEIEGMGCTLARYVQLAGMGKVVVDCERHNSVLSRLPRFTASLDAAMSLVPAGCAWDADASAPECGIDWFVYPITGSAWKAKGTASTPALALTAAALRAIAAKVPE